MSSTSRQYDAVVIGVGGMGSSTLFQLAKRGWKVLGLDKYDIPNALGSSHGSTRIIRLAYHEHPSYIPLMHRAYDLWRELEVTINEKLLFTTGSISCGYEGSSMFSGTRYACDLHNIPYEILNARETNKRFPGCSFDNNILSVYQPNGGFLRADKCISAYLSLASDLGAEIHAREPLQTWKSHENGIEITTPNGIYNTSRLIICAGSWASKLVPELEPYIKPERQVVGRFQTHSPETFRLGNFPVFQLEVNEGRFYGFPSYETPGIKIGKYHHLFQQVDPDNMNREINQEDQNVLKECLIKYFPTASGSVLSLETCLFTNTPDEHFLIGLHPNDPNVSIAAGFSGHGFKFCSLIGEVLSDLAQGGTTSHNIDLFALTRFIGE